MQGRMMGRRKGNSSSFPSFPPRGEGTSEGGLTFSSDARGVRWPLCPDDGLGRSEGGCDGGDSPMHITFRYVFTIQKTKMQAS